MKTNKMIEVSIAGGTGYTAGELLRLLVNHPHVKKINLMSTTSVGQRVEDIHRDLFGEVGDLVFTDQLGTPDLIFLCLGHGLSKSFIDNSAIPPLCKIIDLGNDFRLEPEYKGRNFVYGLVDSFREEISRADNIANPGCFATAIQNAISPIAAAKLLNDQIHITALTGSTGAGKKPSDTTHFSYRNNNISIYKNFNHQHLGEIYQTVKQLMGSESPQINFVPIRGDFSRGIFASIYTSWGGSLEQAVELYEAYHYNSPFVHISSKNISLKEVVNTNKNLLHLELHNGYLHISSIIDNLLKGASGQAVENMNLMFGFDQTLGLKLKANLF